MMLLAYAHRVTTGESETKRDCFCFTHYVGETLERYIGI